MGQYDTPAKAIAGLIWSLFAIGAGFGIEAATETNATTVISIITPIFVTFGVWLGPRNKPPG